MTMRMRCLWLTFYVGLIFAAAYAGTLLHPYAHDLICAAGPAQ